MSTQFEKLIARHELRRRRLESIDRDIKAIESKTDKELEKILTEPDDEEANSGT